MSIIDRFEPGEIWVSGSGVKYEIVSIDGNNLEVIKHPHGPKHGVPALLVPTRVTLRACDFALTVIKNITETAA